MNSPGETFKPKSLNIIYNLKGKTKAKTLRDMANNVSNGVLYNFQNIHKSDITEYSKVSLWDTPSLFSNAQNLAYVLHHLTINFEECYEQIFKILQDVYPSVYRLLYAIRDVKDNKISTMTVITDLNVEDGRVKRINALEDLPRGFIEFLSVITALLQPNLPPMIIIDEPEYRQYPKAIKIISELIRDKSNEINIIIATQSSKLIQYFNPNEIILMKRKGLRRIEPNITNPLISDDIVLNMKHLIITT